MSRGSKLKKYQAMRDFSVTAEPSGKKGKKKDGKAERIFVIQEHHARRLHYDFRLEMDGVLKSWAVTREPSMDPKVKTLAIETEDHPMDYADFHGEIPKGEYGAGEVVIWDHGTYEEIKPMKDAYENGKIVVFLHGTRLKGKFSLILLSGRGRQPQWLFFKMNPEVVGLKIHEKPLTRKKAA